MSFSNPKQSGGKPPFLTCEVLGLALFFPELRAFQARRGSLNAENLAGGEGWFTPAELWVSNKIRVSARSLPLPVLYLVHQLFSAFQILFSLPPMDRYSVRNVCEQSSVGGGAGMLGKGQR